MVGKLATAALLLLFTGACTAVAAPPPPKPDVAYVKHGEKPNEEWKLEYVSDAHGNRVPDFSYAGYGGGGVAAPNVAAKIVVSAVGGDNTQRIQAAIDYVGSLPADEKGIRGAVLLKAGKFNVDGGLLIARSGVVLRGSGMSEDGGTTIIASGTDRRTLIRIVGKDDRKVDSQHALAVDGYVPVGATRLRLRDKLNLKAGNAILIRRPSTAEWIRAISMDYMGGDRHSFSWKPGTRDITWDRYVTKVADNEIALDAPLTTALDPAFGGGTVASYTWPGRINQIGIENLRLESAFDSAREKDEQHSWFAITMESAADAWVRQVTFAHFAGSAVANFPTT